MSTATKTKTDHRRPTWKWNKTQSWSDIIRVSLMFNPDLTSHDVRKKVDAGLASGTIKQVSRGLYRLAKQPAASNK